MVITVYWRLTLTSINSRLSFQKGAPLQGKALSALDLAVSLFPLLSSALLSFLCDTARGGNMTPAAQSGSAQPSPLQLGWVVLPVPPPSATAARLTRSQYKLCSMQPRRKVGHKARTQNELLNRTGCLSTDCQRIKKTERPGPKPTGNTPLLHVCCEEVCQRLVSHSRKKT